MYDIWVCDFCGAEAFLELTTSSLLDDPSSPPSRSWTIKCTEGHVLLTSWEHMEAAHADIGDDDARRVAWWLDNGYGLDDDQPLPQPRSLWPLLKGRVHRAEQTEQEEGP